MKINMGNTDRLLRLFGVAILYMLVYIGVITGALKVVAGFVGIVLAITAFFGICPFYTLIGVSTCPVKKTGTK